MKVKDLLLLDMEDLKELFNEYDEQNLFSDLESDIVEIKEEMENNLMESKSFYINILIDVINEREEEKLNQIEEEDIRKSDESDYRYAKGM